MGHETPKQFLPLGGCPLIVHSLRTIQALSAIREILLMVPPGAEREWRETIVELYGLTKVARVVAGGSTRQDSVSNGLQNVSAGTNIVVIHDGVRPFATPSMFESCIQTATEVDGAIVAVKVHDTTKRVSDDGVIQETIDRNGLWAAQTPQAFRYDVLVAALDRARADHIQMTDEAALVERLGYTVKVHEGCGENIKITTPQDLAIADAFLRWRETGQPAAAT
jgi:2-C-methyl-D-erythritol 4-phosphate cytidylyltransferase